MGCAALSHRRSSPAVNNDGAVSRLLLLPLDSSDDVNHPPSFPRYPDLGPPVEVEVANVL